MRPSLWFAALSTLVRLPAQGLLPCPLPDDVAITVQKTAGKEAFALLGVLGGMDLEARAAARTKWDALDARSRCAVVRAGLRSTDREVAMGAAAMAKLEWLDAAECKRAAAVGLARCLVPDTPFVHGLFDVCDGEDAGRLLAGPIPLPRSDYNFIGWLHRWLGPEHVPHLVQLAHSEDVLLREEVFHTLFTGIALDPTQQDKLAELVLAWPGKFSDPDVDPTVTRQRFTPRQYQLRSPGAGYPPLLTALLGRVFLQPQDGIGGSLAWRWALTAVPGENDRELLTRLCAVPVDIGRQVGVRGLLRLPDGPEAEAIRVAAGQVEEEGELRLSALLALGALASRGEADAARKLARFAASSPLALAVRLQVSRDVTLRELVDEIVKADTAGARAALERLAAAMEKATYWGVEAADPGPALAEMLASKDLDAARLVVLLNRFLGARTKALCEQCMHKMTAAEFDLLPLPVLELHDPDRLAAKLREWFSAAATPAAVRDGVARMLLRAGDQNSARPLWAWVQGLTDAEERVAATLEFGAVGGKDVLQLLGEQVAKEPPAQTTAAVAPLAAMVAAFAGDTRLAKALLAELAGLPKDDFAAAWRAMAGPLLAGAPADAVRGYLAIRPLQRGPLQGLGVFRDVVIPYLGRACEEREHGLYLWATGELALTGMPAARDEIDGAVARRMYGWISHMDPEVLVGRGNAEGVIKALPLLASNCCTYCALASRLKRVFEVDDLVDAFTDEYGFKPRAQMVAERWWEVGERWRWSWLAGKLIAAPR